jgi:hypothetical protein
VRSSGNLEDGEQVAKFWLDCIVIDIFMYPHFDSKISVGHTSNDKILNFCLDIYFLIA